MKGAPETVIPLCSKTLDARKNLMKKFSPQDQKSVLDTEVMKMAKDGLKVLSFAFKDMKIQELEELLQKEGGEENKDFRADIEDNLVYMFTVGIEDPICEEAI